MRHETIRNLPIEVAEGTDEKRNGLAKLAGTWTQEELDRFDAAVSLTERIDEELWCLPTRSGSPPPPARERPC